MHENMLKYLSQFVICKCFEIGEVKNFVEQPTKSWWRMVFQHEENLKIVKSFGPCLQRLTGINTFLKCIKLTFQIVRPK